MSPIHPRLPILVALAIAAAALIGCGGPEELPLIGTWEYSYYNGGVGFVVTNQLEFRADGTVILDPQIGETFDGTWTLDEDQLTYLWGDGSGSTSTIEFVDADTIIETLESGTERELTRV